MRVYELDREQNVILQGIRRTRAAEAERTGLHVSTIIQSILDHIDSSRARHDEIDEATGLAFQEIGNALEDAVATTLVQRIPGWTKPEPRTYRGITGSPDGWSPRAQCIDEIKATWVKESTFLSVDAQHQLVEESVKFIGYKMQILFYMKLWKAMRARLHVLFVCGNHRPPFPSPRPFLLKPTPREIDGNFDMLRQHAIDERMLKAV